MVAYRLSAFCSLAAFLALASSASAGSPACSAIDAANKKQAMTPFHSVTVDGAGQAESITTGGSRYLQMGGQWRKRPYSVADVRLISDTPTATCAAAGTEAIAGEAARVYTVHNATAVATADMRYWISAGRGLPLKTETTLTSAGGKRQIEVRYDYANVRAPM